MDDSSLARFVAATRYLQSLDEIEGWLSIDTALALIELGWEQLRMGLPGGMAEIGVHHGKSFLALAACAAPGEALVAIDVFERQDLNIGGSGLGDRGIFLATVARFFPGVEPRLITGSSEELRGREAAHGLSNLRLMSIDGGHTASLTQNDLQVAEASLGPDGICALDDILSAHWTGVLTGLFRYFQSGGTLVPFCLVPNKLLLCRPDAASHYRRFMAETFGYAQERRELEFGPTTIEVYGAMWAQMNGTLSGLARLVGPEPTTKAVDPNGAHDAVALRQTVLRLETALHATERRLRSTLDSTSWGVTRPLRAMTRLVRNKS